MDPEIRISAEPQSHDPAACRFTVDRSIFPQGFARFPDRERAKDSPLAQKLFEVAGVERVDLADRTVTVRKNTPAGWREIGPMIGAAIRAHVRSGAPAVNPEALAHLPAEDKLRGRIQRILDEQVNPAVASHGGHITLLDVRGNDLYIKMGGGCQGCGAANTTLRDGIERSLREQVPEIGQIFDASDHAAGTNPYYR